MQIKKAADVRIHCSVRDAQVRRGPASTIVSVANGDKSFSFFLRDVNGGSPIWIPEYGVVVLPEGNDASYSETVEYIRSRNLVSKLGRIEQEEEASFEAASRETRHMSAPIIQFYESMGLTEQARRCIQYFIIEWRSANMTDELKGRGYGLLDGKGADPEDQFHQFMLNAYSYLGLKEVTEMLGDIGAEEHEEFDKVLAGWRDDILDSFKARLASSPVVPLSDVTWCPIHFLFAEVVDPSSACGQFVLKYYTDIFCQGNTPFSQPYYGKLNVVQARLGMVKPFLNTYYYTVAPHFDHETGTFWEHYFKRSPHKTNEEAHFLMETSQMLYMERGDTLQIMSFRNGNV